MMTDYAERLRNYNRAGQIQYEWFDEIADYIDKLEADIEEARSALEKIAKHDVQAWAMKGLSALPSKREE